MRYTMEDAIHARPRATHERGGSFGRRVPARLRVPALRGRTSAESARASNAGSDVREASGGGAATR